MYTIASVAQSWTNSNLNHFQQLLFILFPRLLIIIIFLSLTKKGDKTAPQEPKTGYFEWRAPQLSALVNHGTPASGVIGHIPVPEILHVWKFPSLKMHYVSFLKMEMEIAEIKKKVQKCMNNE